jgi:ribulose 1,5-bisphosphate synthetase/thiazole synthase
LKAICGDNRQKMAAAVVSKPRSSLEVAGPAAVSSVGHVQTVLLLCTGHSHSPRYTERTMTERLSRRGVMQMLGTAGLGAGLGLWAGEAVGQSQQQARPAPANVSGGKVIQPQRELPVLAETDVLVVGGGPAGVAAAIAARRLGCRVTITERYGHFGGQWTGGLVLLLDGCYAKGPVLVTRGIGEEMCQRLEKMDRGIINRGAGKNATVDAEALKYLMVEMITAAEIDVFLHSWCADAIVEGSTVRGAVFESKSGRQAILAKMVVDATGDGDVFAAAGAEFELMRYHIGLVHRLGNLDKIDKAKAAEAIKGLDPKKRRVLTGSLTPIDGVNWVNMGGPESNALDVKELTRLELAHRKHIWKQVQELRRTPGYEQVYLVETAPQLGVRMSRLLRGMAQLTWQGFKEERVWQDVIGVGGAWKGDHQAWQIPYRALVPVKIDNILAAGRCISIEPKMADLVRVIAPCWVTGQAAGAAAALSVQERCRPRELPVPKLQAALKQQGAYLG